MATYDEIGRTYSGLRRSDVRIARLVEAALGDAKSVVNVGAGTGSYEPADREVVAVEPSAVMIAQRPAGAASVVQASAESLPFEDDAFDAALAVLTIHHWRDMRAGLSEMCRVARHRVVVLTWVPVEPDFWLTRDYVPELRELDVRIFPGIAELGGILGGSGAGERAKERGEERRGKRAEIDVVPVPIPHDCVDGFLGAYWRRPAAYLDEGIRAGISSFTRIDGVPARMERLRDDLTSGAWARKNAGILELEELDLGYRLVVCRFEQGGARS